MDLVNKECGINCIADSGIIVKRDFIFITIYVLNWLINNKEFDEAARILNIINALKFIHFCRETLTESGFA